MAYLKLRRPAQCAILLVAVLLSASGCSSSSDTKPALATPGKVTLVEFGSLTCAPCKMMEKVLDEIRLLQCPENLDIIFIDVKKHPEMAKAYGVRMIPTQIVFDTGGTQVFHHLGFIGTDNLTRAIAPFLEKKQ